MHYRPRKSYPGFPNITMPEDMIREYDCENCESMSDEEYNFKLKKAFKKVGKVASKAVKGYGKVLSKVGKGAMEVANSPLFSLAMNFVPGGQIASMGMGLLKSTGILGGKKEGEQASAEPQLTTGQELLQLKEKMVKELETSQFMPNQTPDIRSDEIDRLIQMTRDLIVQKPKQSAQGADLSAITGVLGSILPMFDRESFEHEVIMSDLDDDETEVNPKDRGLSRCGSLADAVNDIVGYGEDEPAPIVS